jgi:DNA invertase Pin-like site-specific DNA recombinase
LIVNRAAAEPSRLAVAYYRVSSKEQEKEGYSIPAQQRLLRSYAAYQGIQIVQECEDVETAKRAGRTQFTEMVRFLQKSPACRIILVEKTDRLYRNLKDYVTLDELGVDIHFVKENVVLTPDARSSEKFMHGIKVLMAKNYIDNLSEETRKGMQEKAEEGIWPSRTPLGYRNVVGPTGKKFIEPDEMAPIVARMFEWYATGNYSLLQVTRMAQDAGLVFRRSRAEVPKATVHKILRNRLYTGDFDWKGKTYRGVHTPLVSRELWERVQRVMDRRDARNNRKVKHNFAFSGLIQCGHCGCALVAEIKKKRYVYYHCTGYKGKCPEPFTREEILEDCFADILRGIKIDDEVLALVSQALRESHRDQRQFHDEAIARLQAEYTKIQNRIGRAYDDKLDGVIDALTFTQKSELWRADQERIQQAIADHRQADQSYMEEGAMLLELANRAVDLFEQQAPREKRRLLDFVVSNCTWANGRLTVEFRQPFDLLAVTNEAWRKEKATGGVSSGLSEKWLPETTLNATIRLVGKIALQRMRKGAWNCTIT